MPPFSPFAAIRSRFRPKGPVTIAWGDKKGQPLDQAEDGFLVWWYEKLIYDTEAVVQELARRGIRPPGPAPPPPDPDRVAELRGQLKVLFRAMIQTFHPDKGGTDAEMRIAKEIYDGFKVAIDRWEQGP